MKRGTPSKSFTISDGDLVLTLEAGDLGYYVVTSPLNPELMTQAKTIEEAFSMARDALHALAKSRAKRQKQNALVAAH